MRITIDLPDELFSRAKQRAAAEGVSMEELFIDVVEQRLALPIQKGLRILPTINTGGVPVIDLTPGQIEEAMHGPIGN